MTFLHRISSLIDFCLFSAIALLAQPLSSASYLNPVIPGDHADCTLARVGNHFYTTGSSFNPTPVIYHSTDLVHWEAIAQPVSASWTSYGDKPGGGCWGGHMVYYKDEYWHFFSHGNTMYFVKAPQPQGPWSLPVRINNPPNLPYGLGYDNSIFIDDDHKWYLLVKNGKPNNGIVELGDNGQPTGVVYDLKWLNPDPSYPYSWAEGPVMWKADGCYFYSFARDLGGGQKVMRSDTLTADSSAWEMLGDFFNESDPLKSSSLFTAPNHASPSVMLDDGTSWILHPLYAKSEWKGQGRQGLLNQVRYDADGKPTADYPINQTFAAPRLPSSGIPWMVPKSDFFTSDQLHPEWSFLGYTASEKYSLSERPGWLRLTAKSRAKANTLIKNDGEHNYSLITRLDFQPQSIADEAGLWILRGDETMSAKLVTTLATNGEKAISFSFESSRFEVENSAGDTLWLKLERINHLIYGYFSPDGDRWTQVGQPVDIAKIDAYSDFSTFTGSRQGLMVQGSRDAWFDLYIYRDAYTPILAECPANQFGTTRTVTNQGAVLDGIDDNDWAMYAGVEFGQDNYDKQPDSLEIVAASALSSGTIEVWIDSLDSGQKIAECLISHTGGLRTFHSFTSAVLPIRGRHDVFLKFTGLSAARQLRLHRFCFASRSQNQTLMHDVHTLVVPQKYGLEQNYPNPFNSCTRIEFRLSRQAFVSLKVYNSLGVEVEEMAAKKYAAGTHFVLFAGSRQPSGTLFYTIKANDWIACKRMTLIK